MSTGRVEVSQQEMQPNMGLSGLLFTQLTERDVVQAEDIKQTTDGWVQVDAGEVGGSPMIGGTVFARAYCPIGSICRDDEICHARDWLLWSHERSTWGLLPLGFYGESVASIRNVTKSWVAKPVNVITELRETIPAGYREMFPGERYDITDIYTYRGNEGWSRARIKADVPDLQVVPLPTLDNDFMIFARYCGPVWQEWFISASTGQSGYGGGVRDPWPSLEVAKAKLAAIESADPAVAAYHVGVIFDLDTNRPVFVYDIARRPLYSSGADMPPPVVTVSPIEPTVDEPAMLVEPLVEFAPLPSSKPVDIEAEKQPETPNPVVEPEQGQQLPQSFINIATNLRVGEAMKSLPAGYSLAKDWETLDAINKGQLACITFDPADITGKSGWVTQPSGGRINTSLLYAVHQGSNPALASRLDAIEQQCRSLMAAIQDARSMV